MLIGFQVRSGATSGPSSPVILPINPANEFAGYIQSIQ